MQDKINGLLDELSMQHGALFTLSVKQFNERKWEQLLSTVSELRAVEHSHSRISSLVQKEENVPPKE
jgi:hypothetical protein